MTSLHKAGLLSFFIVSLCGVLFLRIDTITEKIVFQPEYVYPSNQKVYQFHSRQTDTILLTIDGQQIHLIHYFAHNPKGTILYCHGNRGNLKKWAVVASEYVKYGYNVVAWDYQGYGKSTGKPTFSNILTDGKTVFEYIRKTESNIILFGRSLGSGVACKLSSQTNVSKIILETPYYSMKDVIHYHVGFLSHLTKNDIPSYVFIQKTKKPILILHGDTDTVIPLDSAKKLAGNIQPEVVRFIEIPNGKHNNLASFDIYHRSLENFLHD
ncbi:MAG: alpha/beta hydrolase [Saprospiraceae bacterium]|nr:alpha/beta hydrolase [Saprospiraceae bacterium]